MLLMTAVGTLFTVASALSGRSAVPIILLILGAVAIIVGVSPLLVRPRRSPLVLVSIGLITLGAFFIGLTIEDVNRLDTLAADQGKPASSATGQSGAPTNTSRATITDEPGVPTNTNQVSVPGGPGVPPTNMNRTSVPVGRDVPPTNTNQVSVTGETGPPKSTSQVSSTTKLQITLPVSGATFPTGCLRVEGTISNLGSGEEVWLMVVVPPGSNSYYPQNGPATVLGDGTWSSRACLGSAGDFDILAVVVKSDSRNAFAAYRDLCNDTGHCPAVHDLWSGVVVMDRISVLAVTE
jgi:hypothetical protein